MRCSCCLVVLAAMLVVHSTSIAQIDYIPDSNAVWATRAIQPGLFDSRLAYSMAESLEDTTLLGVTYTKLFFGLDGGLTSNVLAGGIRENGQGQVFYFHPNTNQEYLLYDFDVQVGDTVFDVFADVASALSPILHTMYIATVDSVVIGGKVLKTIGIINLQVPSTIVIDWWIESIGGTYGLLTTEAIMPLDVQRFMECMSANDTVWWSGGAADGITLGNCDFASTIDEVGDNLVSELSCFVSGGMLRITDNSEKEVEVTIYRADGKLVYGGSTRSRIDVSALQPGIHLVRLNLKDKARDQPHYGVKVYIGLD